MTEHRPRPDHLMEVGLGFQASKALLAGVELGVFDTLASGAKTSGELEAALGLHPRGTDDFLDALVALGILDRTDGRYHNTPAADAFLVSGKPSYIGGFLRMANDRLYPFWDDLETALETGRTQNELEDARTHPFEGVVYRDDELLEQFVGAMTGLSLGVANALATEFPWDEYESVLDLGTSEGVVPKRIAEENAHITATGLDLPRVEPHFRDFVADSPAADRIEFRAGDFFEPESLPGADVYVLGHILHDWSLEKRREILANVRDAIRPGGAVIVYGTMIDEERREATAALLMSLNMLIETPNGSDYTPSQCIEWLHEAGFEGGETTELPGPERMVVAHA